jgi:undecaprenyl-diphosphatase
MKDPFLRRLLKLLRRFDYRLFWLINGRLHFGFVDAPVRVVNRIDAFLGDAGEILIILLLAALGAWYCNSAGCTPVFLFESVIFLINLIVGVGIKHLARVRRPLFVFGDEVRILSERRYKYSMPSGHTQVAFCVATLLSVQFPAFSWLFYTAAAVIGVYRVYVGSHFPSDVLVGALLGVGVTKLLLRLLPFPL